jgi:hypothetical protein
MAFEALKERWERMEARERRLVSLLGVTFVVCIFGFVGMQIWRGLSAREERNATARNALHLIEMRLADPAAAAASDSADQLIGDTAVSLGSYLEDIAKENQMTIPEQVDKPAIQHGKYTELQMQISLRGVTLDQVAKFLKAVETRQPAVVTRTLRIKPYVSAHEKLDVDLVIATFQKAAKATPAAPAAPAPGGT